MVFPSKSVIVQTIYHADSTHACTDTVMTEVYLKDIPAQPEEG